MMKKPILLSGILLSLLVACGDEVTEVIQPAADSGMAVVAAGDKLSECSKNNVGEMVFVSDSNAVFFCADGKWKTLKGENGSDGKDGTDGKDGEASSSVDTIVVNNQDTLIVRDTLIIKDTISSVDTVVSSAKDTLITRDTVYLKDTIVIYDSTTVFDTTVVKDTLVLEYKPEYDTVTTAYLNQEMLADGKYGILVDKRDNKVYRTVEIGQQTWMAQNLDYSATGFTAYCYNDDPANCKKFGRLYYWTTAVNIDFSFSTISALDVNGNDSILRYPMQGICPEGWHLPDSVEFKTLNEYVSAYNKIVYNEEGVGKSLKSVSLTSNWESRDNVGEDQYGFSAIAGGYFYYKNEKGYKNLGTEGGYWTSSEYSASNAVRYTIFDERDDFTRNNTGNTKLELFSVRCIKD